MPHRTHLHSSHLSVSELGTPYLWFESLSGTESINDLYTYTLILKTKDAQGRPAHGIEGLEGYVSFDAYQAAQSKEEDPTN